MAGERDTSISIDGRPVGRAARPYVIAELSANHNGSLERAKALIDMAQASGVDAVKIQTYRPDTITLDCDAEDFVNRGGLWDGRTLYELYQEAHLPWEWHEPLFRHARERGITLFSSPFDHSAVDLLEGLGAPAYKIASFEAIDLPLIARVARTGKPMIISTGMASLEEIAEAVACARGAGCRELVLLKCTSTYPATPDDTNILTIPDMRKRVGCDIGLSDHTMGVGVSVASIALGACLIEKHFTLRRADGGVDSAFSLEPQELKLLVEEVDRAWRALGEVRYGPTEKEKKSLAFRRSLYITADLKAGDVLTKDNVRAIRPGLGLPPKHLDSVLGRRVRADTPRGTPLKLELLD